MESLLKICWSIESKQKAKIADSMSLLISCSAIFDFYLAKANCQLLVERVLFFEGKKAFYKKF